MRSMKVLLAGFAMAATMFAVACGSGTNPTAPSPVPPVGGGSADVTISISNFAFAPASMTMKVGQTVAWSNNDSTTHTATADGGAFNTGNIAPGSSSAPVKMTTAGTFTYHCSIHPFMTGTLTVQ